MRAVRAIELQDSRGGHSTCRPGCFRPSLIHVPSEGDKCVHV